MLGIMHTVKLSWRLRSFRYVVLPVYPNSGSTIDTTFISRCNVVLFLGFGENTNYMLNSALCLTRDFE